MAKRTSQKAKRAPEWGVAVRLADGTYLYYCREGEGRRGQTSWGRESQAQRFATEAEAAGVAADFERNGAAKEYWVVPLPQPNEGLS